MKLLNGLLLFVMVSMMSINAKAQITEDPTNWKYEVKKVSGNKYQVLFHLDIKEPWHIWSLHPGGDGYEIAPTFTLDKNPNVKLVGKVTEKGKAITTTMTGIDGKITYLSGKIEYVQNVTVTAPCKIKGKHMYQVCNDKMCLAPKDKEFEVEVK